MRANIIGKIVASLPRLVFAVLFVSLVVPRLIVVALLVFLAVSPALAGQFQPDARAESDGASPTVSPAEEGSGDGRSDAPEVLTAAPDTSVVTRWTVDSGGGMVATGSDFELSGTIGQPDAGLADGGEFTLAGGFWFPLDDGDCNTDGCVDLIDFDGFQPCFSGPGDGVGLDCRCYDVDQDGDVDLSDVAAFQHAFNGA